MRPQSITGLGIDCALGIGRDAFFGALSRDEKAAIGTVSTFDKANYPNPRLAEVPDFDPTKFMGDKGLRTLDRLTKLSVVAARLALHDSGIKRDGEYATFSPDRVGFCASNAYGSLEAITELDRVAQLEDARYINPAKFPNTVANSASGYVSIWEDIRALNVTVSDGNCGGLDAFACAELHLEGGRADAIVVGGAEAMSEALYLAFEKLGALESSWLGEGAAMMTVEPADVAKKRGAKVLGNVIGYGTAFLPPESEALLLHASSEAMGRAIRLALDDASVAAKDVDLVISGVSGIHQFDGKEISAIREVFGNDTPIAAPKNALGETLGASGAMAVATSLAWMNGVAKPTVIHGSAPSAVKTVVVTAMGFYGNASALVLQKPA